MKVCYFNDTKKTQVVYCESFLETPNYLKPQSMVTVDIPIDQAEQMLFVKVWQNGNVLISTASINNEV